MTIKISDQFDAGAIEVVDASNPEAITLNIRKDSQANFLQWFHFRLQGARDQPCTMRFLNAGNAAFPQGWSDYRAVASYDRKHWFRVPTSYDGNVLTVTHTPKRDSVYYAYFEPYSWERHLDLLGRVESAPHGRVLDLGSTIDGRDMNLAVIGDPAAAKKIWVIARQHPGESMAEWFIEGMVDALLDRSNSIATKLLAHAVFYIVPNMNPDGSVRGNLRTNAAGANLNREWMSPSMERSPEVFVVRNKLHEVGCDLFLDIHGDESLPYVFVAGCEMLEGFTAEQQAEQQAFIESFAQASPDFQTKRGYEAGKYKEELLQLASKYVGHTFKCVSLTLEMPFKDNANLPDDQTGWNGARSARLGQAILQPILHSLQKGKAWD
ncbi:MAG TPA: M14-type cytosolic carboxypeptidase [Noviherbaspirillum sp.]|uniref:M14 family metallopeptidase n=1 Tax=Noviherbaspirillum sp. TaxID=1926288 RepID=UPI002B485F57|nr:M14-type cytosolic carboxypeptidase [Noviherbaspirillum sp.]HJV85740.1 M14-type cytosolic carboxypeptidase [Noviherbaspirillum sp.]